MGYTCSALLSLILGDSLFAVATGVSSRDGGPAVAKAPVSVFAVAPAAASVPSGARHVHHLVQQAGRNQEEQKTSTPRCTRS